MKRFPLILAAAASLVMLASSDAFARRIDVEVGPIYSHRQAERICPRAADRFNRDNPRFHAEWNGAWRTTERNRMSVCGLDVRERRHHEHPHHRRHR